MDEEFVESVLALVEQVPAGRVTTYGAIATALQRGGPRQVGRVMSTHGGLVCWWRVVHADGSPATCHDGAAVRHLLAESTPMRNSGRVAMAEALWPLPDPASLEDATPWEFAFDGALVEWRGPAPYYFVEVPLETSQEVKLAARGVEYWGQVPVIARIEAIDFRTGLFPKDGRYLLPVKNAVRTAVEVELGEVVAVAMSIVRDHLGEP